MSWCPPVAIGFVWLMSVAGFPYVKHILVLWRTLGHLAWGINFLFSPTSLCQAMPPPTGS